MQLAQHTGLSPALLSKIERGQLFPTLPTLLRIAMVFGVGLEHFFVETGERPSVAITRKQDRVRLPDRPGAATPSYLFESLNSRLLTARSRRTMPSSRHPRSRRSRTSIPARSSSIS